MPRRFGWLFVAAIFAGVAVNWQHTRSLNRRDSVLAASVSGIRALASADRIDCEGFKLQKPLVLLVLGQSNAGNHGERTTAPDEEAAIQVMHDGVCGLSRSPLPGGTGDGASIWTLLPRYLQQAGVQRPIVIQLLAVDATSIGDWTDASSPVRRRLEQMLVVNKAIGLMPNLVLWQQGEADARLRTSQAAYREGLEDLGRLLDANGVSAPVIMALSTVCRGGPYGPVRTAISQLASMRTDFRIGPDTDALYGSIWRRDGCHWSQTGRGAAALKWRDTLLPYLLQ